MQDDTASDPLGNKRMSKSDYDSEFGISENGIPGETPHDKQKAALDQALDIRKFEISLYWTRAAYFLAFNTLALGGYGALQTGSVSAPPELSVLVSCLGLVCSFAWYCANRGSKQWQENWENHVDLLEDRITGPLYKIVIKRPRTQTRCEWAIRQLTGPAAFSVSRINQIISVYITAIWGALLVQSMIAAGMRSWLSWAVLILTLAAITAILGLGRTYEGPNENEARVRKSSLH